jgi:predicted acylesterase/phospholipase RssA
MIKHIVLSGGGPTGFLSYGCIKSLLTNKFINFDYIETLYGTSIGGIIGVMFALKYDIQTLDDYLIKRPWQNIFTLDPDAFLNLFYSKSLYEESVATKLLKTLFEAKDISLDITLKEFYEYTKINLHLFTVEINNLKLVDLNYESFPDLKLMTALEMTSAVPFFNKPVFYDNKCYLDGGLLNNYPLKNCIENEKCDVKSIIGIKNKYSSFKLNFEQEMNLLQFYSNMIGVMIHNLQAPNISEISIPYEIECICHDDLIDYNKWVGFIIDYEKRKNLIDEGEKYGNLFVHYVNKLNNNESNENELHENGEINENII